MSRIDDALRLARREPARAGGDQAESAPRRDSLGEYPLDAGVPLPRSDSDEPEPLPRIVKVAPGGRLRRTLTERLAHLGEKVVTDPSASRTLVEEFRRFATKLSQQYVAHHGLVMVSSALAAEGKTMTATNLALTLSGSFKEQVLLVDADLRRPTLQTVFGVEGVGLTEWIEASEPSSPNAIQLSDTLTFLPAGHTTEDPFAVLNSPAMKQLLRRAATEFTWVVIDTPPVALVPDARIIGSLVDLIVLVVRAESTPYTAVDAAIQELGRDRISGIVLNQAEANDLNRDYGSYAYTSRPTA